MYKHAAWFLVLVMVGLLPSFGSEGQPHNGLTSPATHNPASAKHGLHELSTSKQAAYARRLQTMTSDPPVSHIGFFSAAQNPAGGNTLSPFPAVLGDFRGDGNQDAVTVAQAFINGKPPLVYAISVELSNGNGTFNNVLTSTSATEYDPIFVGDLNGDGKDDIVMIHQGSPAAMTVWLSNGDGTFTQKATPIPGPASGAAWATLSHLNGDKNFDLVVVDQASPSYIWTLKGNGDGTFGSPSGVSLGVQLSANTPPVFADFDGDGTLDVAGLAASSNQLLVILNNGAGGYKAPEALNTPDNIYDACFIAGGNLSGHSTMADIVTANCYNNSFDNNITVFVNKGDGTGTFQNGNTGVYYPVDSDPLAVTIADVNGDGKNDIVSHNRQSADVSILLGNGDGTFPSQSPAVGYITGGTPTTAALVADFNKDGKADIILPDGEFGFVYLEGYGDGSFRSAVNYYAPGNNGYQPYGVAIATGDFNGDGSPDFVIGNLGCCATQSGVTVFLANKDGSMQPGVNYQGGTGSELSYVAVADFNGDGKLDIAATDSLLGGVQIFAGNGDGTFTVGSTYPSDTVKGVGLGLVVGDFNGDGWPDLAVVNNTNSGANADVGVLINDKKGGFLAPVNYPLHTVATEITAADLGNKKLDLVVPLYGTNATPGTAVAVLLGNGNGTFQAEKDTTVGNNPYAAVIGDLNGDGKPDLAVTIDDQTTPSNQGIAIALGNGDGTFQTPTLLPSTLQDPRLDNPLPGYVKMVDLDRDGHLDLVYTNSKFGTLGIMYGKGNGTFYDPVEYPAGRWAFDMALADVNAAGAIDVVATGNSRDFSGVSVLMNTSGNFSAVASSNNPAAVGTAVSFTATVSPIHGVTNVPTGSVTFKDGTNVLGSGKLNSSGVAALGIGSLAVGSHSITAQYNGDVNFVPTTSPLLNQVVAQATDSTAVKSSANPATPGQSVTFTATVADNVGGDSLTPTGKVTFSDGSKALGSGTLNSSGVATFSTSSLAAGSHSITAQYAGDANFSASASSALNQIVVVPDYSLGANPTSQTVKAGSSAQYTIAVTPSNGYDGTITFSCSGLPAESKCSFNPSSVGAGTKQTVLTITTTGPSVALVTPPALAPRSGQMNLWASLSGVGMVGLLLTGDYKKRNRRRMTIVLGIVALVMILAIVGCGGSSSSSGGGGGSGGTPVGDYQIKVTATGTAGTNGGNTSPHLLNVTLNVTQ